MSLISVVAVVTSRWITMTTSQWLVVDDNEDRDMVVCKGIWW